MYDAWLDSGWLENRGAYVRPSRPRVTPGWRGDVSGASPNGASPRRLGLSTEREVLRLRAEPEGEGGSDRVRRLVQRRRLRDARAGRRRQPIAQTGVVNDRHRAAREIDSPDVLRFRAHAAILPGRRPKRSGNPSKIRSPWLSGQLSGEAPSIPGGHSRSPEHGTSGLWSGSRNDGRAGGGWRELPSGSPRSDRRGPRGRGSPGAGTAPPWGTPRAGRRLPGRPRGGGEDRRAAPGRLSSLATLW